VNGHNDCDIVQIGLEKVHIGKSINKKLKKKISGLIMSPDLERFLGDKQ
jgi:hypothetical protein